MDGEEATRIQQGLHPLGTGEVAGCCDLLLRQDGTQHQAHPKERNWRSFLSSLSVVSQAVLARKVYIQGQIEPLLLRRSPSKSE